MFWISMNETEKRLEILCSVPINPSQLVVTSTQAFQRTGEEKADSTESLSVFLSSVERYQYINSELNTIIIFFHTVFETSATAIFCCCIHLISHFVCSIVRWIKIPIRYWICALCIRHSHTMRHHLQVLISFTLGLIKSFIKLAAIKNSFDSHE